MADQLIPVLKVSDTARAAEWYARLGFVKEWEDRYSPEFPGYLSIARGELELHLSERAGDATPDSLLYLSVDDVGPIAAEFGTDITEEKRAYEVHLTDPDGNRIRVGARKPNAVPV